MAKKNSQNPAAPLVESLQDLTIVESLDPSGKPKSTTFYHITKDEEVYVGQTSKNKRETTIPEFNAALQRIPDQDIYPAVPADSQLTLAPEGLDEPSVYVKRPGLQWYDEMRGTNWIPQTVLDETLVMEKISQSQPPHPNIIQYHGCRVRRGYITCIVLEQLDQTLHEFVSTDEWKDFDKTAFCESVASAVEFLHSLGLAHNDINPYNIMLRTDRTPALIDFDSCQPVGHRLQSLGTEGWYEKPFYTSEKEHDLYALGKLREWIQDPR